VRKAVDKAMRKRLLEARMEIPFSDERQVYMNGGISGSCSIFPGIEERNASRLEVADISCDNGEAMHNSGSSDQGIAIWARIMHLQNRSSPGYGNVGNQNSTGKSRQNLIFQP
jgi:hypothetical protein